MDARKLAADAASYRNRYDDALRLLDDAGVIASTAHDEVALGIAWSGRLHPLARMGRLDEAIAAGERARAHFEGGGDHLTAAKTLVNLGVAHRMRNDPVAALACFDDARPTFAANSVTVAQIDSNRAEAMLDLGRFDEAEATFDAALATFTTHGIDRAAAIVRGNLADLMSRGGRVQEALEQFEAARHLFEAADAPGDAARLEAEQSEAMLSAGLWPEAVTLYESAIPRLDANGLAAESARARLGQGRALSHLHRRGAAAAALDDAARRFATLGHDTGAAQVRLERGEHLLAIGRPAEATAELAEALRGLSERPLEAARAGLALTRIALDHGDVAAATTSLERAFTLLPPTTLSPLLADLLHCRADLHRRLGDEASARADLEAAMGQLERVRGSLPAERLRMAVSGDRARIAEDLVAVLLESGAPDDAEAALHVVEMNRSRALLDLVVDAAAGTRTLGDGTGPADRLLDALRALAPTRHALASRLHDLHRDGDLADVGIWSERLDEVDRRIRSLEARLASVPGFGRIYATAASTASILAAIPDDTAIISFSFTGDDLATFVLRPGGLHVERSAGVRADLIDAIDHLHLQMERAIIHRERSPERRERMRRTARTHLADLGAMLIGPLREAIGDARHLVMIPHGPLHGVPLHALIVDDRHLIEDVLVTSAPSATIATRLPRVRNDDESRAPALLVGVGDARAPRIEPEIDAIARSLPDATRLVGADATAAALARAVPGVGLVHLACHARFMADRAGASGLCLADGWLTAHELRHLDLRGATVVLTGCETGRSVIEGADEPLGLTRALFAAGARRLMLSLWLVHDESAAELVASVYRSCENDGTSLPDALRRAQVGLIASGRHPADWAPFILVGGL